MKKLKIRQISTGLFSIVTGLLLMLLRGSALNLVITIIGIGLIASVLAFGMKHLTKFSIMKIIIGISMIVFGNTYINLSMYLLGISLIILGAFKFKSSCAVCNRRSFIRILFFQPVLTIIAGVLILFNPTGSVEFLFYVCGLLMMASGIFDVYYGLRLHI